LPSRSEILPTEFRIKLDMFRANLTAYWKTGRTGAARNYDASVMPVSTRREKLKMQEFDPRTANVARMYDHYLGGKDNFEVDRASAGEIMRLSPRAAVAAHDNRRFLGRAVAFVARSGVIQFIDIGAGLPTMENTHEIAAKENQLSRVVYIDNDPVAVNHATVLLASASRSLAILGDLREARQIIENETLRDFLDMSQPVAIILAAILHFIDDPHACAIVDYLKQAVPPGSALVISHATADEASGTEIEKVQSVYEQSSAPIFLRTHAGVARFFDGFELVEPGVVDINAWQTIGTPEESQTIGYGGVAIKPLAAMTTLSTWRGTDGST
jgi:hypothetical protein